MGKWGQIRKRVTGPGQAPGLGILLRRIGYSCAVLVLLTGLAHRLQAQTDVAFAADKVLGQYDATGNPTFATGWANSEAIPSSGGVGSVRKLAIDPVHHRLFVPDYSQNRVLIHQLDDNNHYIDNTAEFVLGQPNFQSTTAALSVTGIETPSGVTYDPNNNWLFVSCANQHRVLVYDLSGGISNGMAANHVLGQATFTQNTLANPPTAASLNAPQGMVYDQFNQRLFVASYSDSRIMVWDLAGGLTDNMNASYAIGAASLTVKGGTTAQNRTTQPAGVALDIVTSGATLTRYRLLVADAGNNRVLVFDLLPGIATAMNASLVLGQASYTVKAAGSGASGLNSPQDVVFDSATQRVFVGDTGGNNNRVMVYSIGTTPTNGMAASYVLGKNDFADTVSDVTQTKTKRPWGLAFDPISKQLLVADIDQFRVLGFNLANGITSGMPAVWVWEQTDNDNKPIFTKAVQNNPHTRETGMNGPTGLALDPANHWLFVGDTYNRRVLVYRLDSTNAVSDKAASFVLGQPDFATNKQWPTAANTINAVGALAYDAARQRLFMADNYLNRVLIYDLSSGIQNNMNAAFVLGQTDFAGGVAGTTAYGLKSPAGLAYDTTANRLFVSDQVNNRVEIFDLASGVANGMAASAVLGQPGFATVTAGSGASGLNRPFGLTIDVADERLFVTDYGNCRILVYALGGVVSSGVAANNVLGQADFTSAPNCTASQNTVGAQVGSATYDPANKVLFVGDGNNNRVVKFDLSTGIRDGMDANGVLGQTNFTSATANAPDGKPASTNMTLPRALLYDSANQKMFVADFYNNRVLQMSFARMIPLPSPQLHAGQQYIVGTAANLQGVATFSLASGALPKQLSLNQQTGALEGPLEETGQFDFTIDVEVDMGAAGTTRVQQQYSLEVLPPAPEPGPPAETPQPPDQPTATTPQPPPTAPASLLAELPTQQVTTTPGTPNQPAGIAGNPANLVLPETAGTTPNDGIVPGSCQKVVTLDTQPDFQNGNGYQTDADNCYMFLFTTSDSAGNTTLYANIIDNVNTDSVDMTVAPATNVHQTIAQLAITKAQTGYVETSQPATTAFQVKVAGIQTPQATLRLARVFKRPPDLVARYQQRWWLIIPAITAVFVAILVFARAEKRARVKRAE